MATAELNQIVKYADSLLNIREFEDWPGAVNGLLRSNESDMDILSAASQSDGGSWASDCA